MFSFFLVITPDIRRVRSLENHRSLDVIDFTVCSDKIKFRLLVSGEAYRT